MKNYVFSSWKFIPQRCCTYGCGWKPTYCRN